MSKNNLRNYLQHTPPENKKGKEQAQPGEHQMIAYEGEMEDVRGVRQCRASGCKTCPLIKSGKEVKSTVTGRLYWIKIPKAPLGLVHEMLDCKTRHLVYLATCTTCGVQYVGETIQPLHKRVGGHRSNVEGKATELYVKAHSPYFATHFREECSWKAVRFQPLEVVKEADGENALLLKRENVWIRELRTFYPFGLNFRTEMEKKVVLEDVRKTGKRGKHKEAESEEKLSEESEERRERKRIARKAKRNRKRDEAERGERAREDEGWLEGNWLDEKLDIAKGNQRWIREVILEVRTLTREKRIRLRKEITIRLTEATEGVERMLLMIRLAGGKDIPDDIESKKEKRKRPSLTLKVLWENPAFEFTGIKGLIRSKAMIDRLPFGVETDGGGCAIDLDVLPVVLFSYVQPVRNEILNYKEVLESAAGVRLEDIPCECATSEHTDAVLGHILTGELSIVENRRLRELIAKGPKFRERRKLDFDKALEEVTKGLDDLILKWSAMKEIDIKTFQHWKNGILEGIRNNLEQGHKVRRITLKRKRDGEGVLTSKEGKEALAKLHAKYAFVPIDKSENNVSVICKRYYVQKQRKELGLEEEDGNEGNDDANVESFASSSFSSSIVTTSLSSSSSSSSSSSLPPLLPPPQPLIEINIADAQELRTYRLIDDSVSEIVELVTNKLGALEIIVEMDMQKLGSMYWTPKMHKNPPGARFILNSMKCVTKPLSAILTNCLRLVQKSWKEHCKFYQSRTGVNTFWISEGTEDVLDVIEKVNKRGNARTVETYDFSTLYTKIEHTDLKEELKWLIEETFKREEGKVMAVYEHSAKFVVEAKAGTRTLNAQQLLELAELLVDNIYVSSENRVLRQCIGIPMGTDCAPFLANLYLFAKEYKFIKEQIRQQAPGYMLLVARFELVKRFIDDLFNVNGDGVIAEYMNQIYPASLVLNKENEHNHKTHFLDINLVINDGYIRTSLYDKRDDFPFAIRSFPDLSGNIPFDDSHDVLTSQLIRIAIREDHFTLFSKRLQNLTDKLMAQHFSRERLAKLCARFYDERLSLVLGFKTNKTDFVNACFTT
jgi:hypothetical protein